MLLDVDEELFQGVEPAQRKRARACSLARTVSLFGPKWDPTGTVATDEARRAGAEWLGLLVLEGVLVCEVTFADRASCELVGPGDVLRPWDTDTESGLEFPNTVEWLVARRTTLALLDASFARRTAPWPTVTNQIMARLSRRIGYQALAHAVSHASSVEDRLPAFFWLLAQRWGTAMSEGVRVELPFTHQLLGVLVGARRPTITIALGHLREQGLLIRQPRNRWLLSWEAVRRLTDIHGDQASADMTSRNGRRTDALTVTRRSAPEP